MTDAFPVDEEAKRLQGSWRPGPVLEVRAGFKSGVWPAITTMCLFNPRPLQLLLTLGHRAGWSLKQKDAARSGDLRIGCRTFAAEGGALVVPFKLSENEIWPDCREIEIRGELDLAISGASSSLLSVTGSGASSWYRGDREPGRCLAAHRFGGGRLTARPAQCGAAVGCSAGSR